MVLTARDFWSSWVGHAVVVGVCGAAGFAAAHTAVPGGGQLDEAAVLEFCESRPGGDVGNDHCLLGFYAVRCEDRFLERVFDEDCPIAEEAWLVAWLEASNRMPGWDE